MNAKNLIAAVAILTAGSAFAAGNDQYVDFSNFVSTKNRADVVAELNQAANQPVARSTEYVEFANIASGKTRAEVRTEQAQAGGQSARNQEFVEFTNIASTKTRDEVRNEVIQAAQARRAGYDSSGN